MADPLRALRHPALLVLALVAIFYNLGFFTLLAAGPFALPSLDIMQIGWVFFGWGVLLAVTSVVVAPFVQRLVGTVPALIGCLVLLCADLAIIAWFAQHEVVVAAGIIAAGAVLGVNNTLVTEAVMGASPVERPVASAAYSFVRFTGGAVGPYVALKLAEHHGVHAPFWFGAAAVAVGIVIAVAGARTVVTALRSTPTPHSPEHAEAELYGDAG